MIFNITTYLKIFIRITAITGVIITLCNLKGCFVDEDRQGIYNKLQQKSSEYRVPISTPEVAEFLAEFYFSKAIPPEMRLREIKGLMLKWMAIGNNPPMSGTVHVEFMNGKSSTSLCRLDELKQWSIETDFYAWLGWWLLALSVTSEVAIDVIGYKQKMKKSVP